MADLEIDPAPMVVILNVLTVILPPDKALSFKLLIIVFVLFFHKRNDTQVQATNREVGAKCLQQTHMDFLSRPLCNSTG